MAHNHHHKHLHTPEDSGGHYHAGHSHAGHSHAGDFHETKTKGGHLHGGHVHGGHVHGGSKNILTALLLNLGFTVIEIIGGLLSNSLAVLSDAVHDLGDSLALGMSYYAEKKSGEKAKNQNYTFGLRRLPLISAALNALILLGGSAWVVANAVPRLQNPEPIESGWMIGLGVLGVAVNGMAVLKLRGNAGINSRVVALHLMEDALGWVAVLIGAIVIFFTGYYIIDPILSLLIAGYVFYGAFKNLRDVYYLLVQRSPAEVEVPQLKKELEALQEVQQITDLHVWSLEGTHHILSLHALVRPELNPEEQLQLKQQMRAIIKNYGEIHSTLELDHFPEACGDHC